MPTQIQPVPSLPFPVTVPLAGLHSPTGFIITGESAGDHSGFAVSAGQDVNQDGILDVVIGAPEAEEGGGRSYVVFAGAALGQC